MTVRKLISLLVELPMDSTVSISVKTLSDETYHFSDDVSLVDYEDKNIGIYGVENKYEKDKEATVMEIARGTFTNGTKFIISKLDGYYAIWFGDDFEKAEYTGCSTAGTLEQIMDELKEVI